MKKIYFTIVLCILLLVLIFPASRGPGIPVSVKRLYADVRALTSIQPPRGYRNTASLDRAAAYIFGQFAQCTGRVETREYEVEGNTYKNIIASFGPETKHGKRIVVGAHYDVCGDQPGADDNASGVAAVLEIARLFAALKPHLKRRIDLAAYSLEEPPFFRSPHMGSAVHAKSLAEAKTKILVMISVDMIGYFSDTAKPHPYFSPFIKPGTVIPGRTTSIIGKKGQEKITRKIKKYMLKNSRGIAVAAFNLPIDIMGVDYSDHMNFWNHGYKAVFISNFPVSPNPNYHQPADTIDALDFDKISEIVKGIYYTLVKL